MPQVPTKSELFVSQMIAGNGISLTPASGTGVVKIDVDKTEGFDAISGNVSPFPISGKAGVGTGPGGTIQVTGGDSGPGATGDGGPAQVTGGRSTSSNGNGGSVVLAGGVKTGTGVAGGIRNESIVLSQQGAPAAKTTSSVLAAADLLSGIITVNQGAAGASAQQLPAAAALQSALPADAVAGDSFDFSVINTSTVAAEAASLTTNTGWTLVGDMDIQANSAATTKSSGRFRARLTGAGAFTLYRLS